MLILSLPYQLALTTPGISPFMAMSRIMLRHRPNLRNTTRGWWEALDAKQQAYVRAYLGLDKETASEAPHWQLIRLACASVAALCVVPMQDVLGLDSAHRMNEPSLSEGSWEWRFSWDQVDASHAHRLAELTRLYGRTR